jgi:hypothetical protein
MLDDVMTLDVPYDQIHDLSLQFMELMEGDEWDPGVREVALAVTIARLCAFPKILKMDEEQPFVEKVIELAGVFFPAGGIN